VPPGISILPGHWRCTGYPDRHRTHPQPVWLFAASRPDSAEYRHVSVCSQPARPLASYVASTTSGACLPRIHCQETTPGERSLEQNGRVTPTPTGLKFPTAEQYFSVPGPVSSTRNPFRCTRRTAHDDRKCIDHSHGPPS